MSDWAECSATLTAPAERIAAGSVLGLVGDPRVPAVPAVVDIPGGEFRMGTDDERLDRAMGDWAHLGLQRSWLAKETPARPVRVGAFRLGRYPVTNGQ